VDFFSLIASGSIDSSLDAGHLQEKGRMRKPKAIWTEF
jgi:hypothetical protein